MEFVIKKFDRRPKVVRFDRGSEYIGKAVENFLNSQGTQIHLTAGYSPEQNGVAERKNRTLVEMGRCLLIQSRLPKKLWGDGQLPAESCCYKGNKCHTVRIMEQFQTQFEPFVNFWIEMFRPRP